jgi:predicted dehydrogenase
MGRRHAQIVCALGLDLVGICDRFADAVRAAGEEHGVPAERRFNDPATMVAATRPDCLIVATHAPSHCEAVCLAAGMGVKHILCEKPMAVSLSECDRMLEACRQAGARLAINHQMRFMEQYTEPKRVVQSAEFGGLSSVTVVAGNFGLAMNGSHYFEMFRYLTDEPPYEATAWFSAESVPNPRGAEFEDKAGSVRVTTAGGRRMYLEASADQGHGMNVIYAGPYGRLFVDELAGTMHLAARNAEHRGLPTSRYGMPWSERAWKIKPADAVAPSRAVLEALLNGRDYPTGEDGRMAVATLAAAYASHEQGHVPVRLDDSCIRRERKFPWA